MHDLGLAPPVLHAVALTHSRCYSPRLSWTGEATAEVTVRAPVSKLFAAYENIERIPEWLPLLESVVIVDQEARRSEWALRVPRQIYSLANGAGFGTLVRWEAIHDVVPNRQLTWRSISGLANGGEVTFVALDGDEEAGGVVTLRMEYTVPDVAKPLVENVATRRFLRRIVRRTMERFRDALELEVAGDIVQRAR